MSTDEHSFPDADDPIASIPFYVRLSIDLRSIALIAVADTAIRDRVLRFLADDHGANYISCMGCTREKSLLSQIAATLGIPQANNDSFKLHNAVIEALKSHPRPLFCNPCDSLSPGAFEVLREIGDVASVPIIIGGASIRMLNSIDRADARSDFYGCAWVYCHRVEPSAGLQRYRSSLATIVTPPVVGRIGDVSH